MIIPIIVTGIVVIIFILSLRYYRKGIKNPPYIEALNALLVGRKDEAIHHLKEAVRVDSENIDAYIKLGDLLRDKGDYEKALRIHQSLTVRKDLPRDKLRQINLSLALDQIKKGNGVRAFIILRGLIKENPKDRIPLDHLIRMIEEHDLYLEAIEFLKHDGRRLIDKRRQAIYHLKAGMMVMEKDRKTADDYFQKARRLAPDSPLLLHTLADFDIQKEHFDDAVLKWQKVLSDYPDLLMILKDRIENAYFEANRFGEIEDLYESLFNKHQYNIPIALSLVKIYEKKGEREKLKGLLERMKECWPDLLILRLIEINLHLEPGPAKDILNEVIKNNWWYFYQCAACGTRRKDFLWRCPSCGSWECFRLSFPALNP